MTKQTTIVVTGALRINVPNNAALAELYLKWDAEKRQTLISIRLPNSFDYMVTV